MNLNNKELSRCFNNYTEWQNTENTGVPSTTKKAICNIQSSIVLLKPQQQKASQARTTGTPHTDLLCHGIKAKKKKKKEKN